MRSCCLLSQATSGWNRVSPVLALLLLAFLHSSAERVTGLDEQDLDADAAESAVDGQREVKPGEDPSSLLSEGQAASVKGRAVRAVGVGSIHQNHSTKGPPINIFSAPATGQLYGYDNPEIEFGSSKAQDHARVPIRLTQEQLALFKDLEDELEREQKKPPGGLLDLSDKPTLLAVAGGIGASVGNTGSVLLDKDLIRRMKVQDVAVMLLLLLVYFATLFFTGVLAHKQVYNNSRVKYYADPRMFIASCVSRDADSFMEAFNVPPQQALLRVSGYREVHPNSPHGFQWKDGTYVLAFSFSLDLTSWVQRGEEGEDEDDPNAGVNEEDLEALREFLANNKNELAIVQLDKRIYWDDWDELALNIKSKIRQSGFEGMLHVDRTELEEMPIYRNTQWANFLHGKSLKVLLALSVVGWMIYGPYMWIRCKKLTVRCKHRITMPIDTYWENISAGLTAQGFSSGNQIGVSWPVEDSSDNENSQAQANLNVQWTAPS